MNKDKPYWWPDAQGFAIGAIIFLCGSALYIRMFHAGPQDDKMLDTMITILFSTCLVTVYQYLFGSSRGSATKDDTINKIATDTVKPTAANDNVKALVLFAVLILGALAFPGDVMAQGRPLQITGKPFTDAKANLGIGGATASSGRPLGNILNALDDKLLPDLQYALKLATASGSKVTGPCYQAWINIIVTRQTAVTNADGTALDLPNPRLITDFEKGVELRNALQPDSDFMLKCSPVASMVRKDITSFIGLIISGGAGLAALGL